MREPIAVRINAILCFFKKPNIRNSLTSVFFVLSVISCFFTYTLFSDVDLYNRSFKKVISILYLDIAFILILLMLGSNKIIELWSDRHKKGSRLTLRLIFTFSLLSVVPSVLMSIFSAVFFHNGIESWFNERNRIVLQESLNVADSYLSEHRRNTQNDCLAITKTLEYHLEKVSNIMDIYHERFARDIGFLLDDLCGLKGVKAAILLDSALNVVACSKYSVSLHFLNINYRDLQDSSEKKCVTLDSEDEGNKIIAISCFKNHQNDPMYLILEKDIDSKIISHAKNTRNAYTEYHQLMEERSSMEIAFVLMFLIIGVLLLIASIAVAIIYSWRIVKPISNLINVSESIIKGNLMARAKETSSYEEISLLSKTFNQMVNRVHKQREDLETINKKLDERIKFTGSVLAGVSSGVIGIENNSIYIWNSAAEKLLGKKIVSGEHIGNVFPELHEPINAINSSELSLEREIQYKKDSNVLLFLVKIENIGVPDDYSSRFVITFDDMTSMVMSQRKAAWSDAARRVAHEIKNPLTPIQLSAERIRRKYISQILVDSETFSSLVDVIIRQVGDIKRLIDNFNKFAQLPEPSMRECNLYEVCKQAVFLMQNAGKDVHLELLHDKDSYITIADERLLHQSIVNLLKNAMNALEASNIDNKKIWVTISEKKDTGRTLISVEDNGPGFPEGKMESLATPYFTLMPKGTGLGLAIVKKMIQDHGGELLFGRSSFGGASVTVSLPSKF